MHRSHLYETKHRFVPNPTQNFQYQLFGDSYKLFDLHDCVRNGLFLSDVLQLKYTNVKSHECSYCLRCTLISVSMKIITNYSTTNVKKKKTESPNNDFPAIIVKNLIIFLILWLLLLLWYTRNTSIQRISIYLTFNSSSQRDMWIII